MLKKLEYWIQKQNDEKLQNLYTEYLQAEKNLEEVRSKFMSYLSTTTQFSDLVTQALETKTETTVIQEVTNSVKKVAKQIKNGRDFKAIRKAKYFTQNQAAEAIGVSVHLIRNWEQHNKEIPSAYKEKANTLCQK